MFVEPSVNIGGKRKYTVLLSIVAHTLVIAAALIVPLVATDSIVLPARFAMVAFHSRPPLPPSLPPPSRRATEPVTIATPAVPMEAPPAIIAEIPIQTISEPFATIESSAGIVSGEFAPPVASAPPAAAPVQVSVRPGGDIKQPVKIKDVAPAYPKLAQIAKVEGIVIIEATIGPDGRVQDARILRSNPLLDAAARDAVRRWEYTPTLLNGVPVAVIMTVTVNFRLR
jgi:periplasmic protein TonB